MTSLLRTLLLPSLLLALSSQSFASTANPGEKEYKECEAILAHLNRHYVITNLNYCQGVYFSAGQDDNATLWRKIIKLGMRSIEISESRSKVGVLYKNDQAIENTLYAIFNLWSAWKEHPELQPEGAHGLEDIDALVERTRKFNEGRPEFNRIVADQYLVLFWQMHDRYAGKLIAELANIDKYTKDQKDRVRARTDIARTYRDIGDRANALEWVDKALALDPTFKPAVKIKQGLVKASS